MAITKIMCMKSAEHGNVAAHLKHSIAYICNEAKTENGSLVGGMLFSTLDAPSTFTLNDTVLT